MPFDLLGLKRCKKCEYIRIYTNFGKEKGRWGKDNSKHILWSSPYKKQRFILFMVTLKRSLDFSNENLAKIPFINLPLPPSIS